MEKALILAYIGKAKDFKYENCLCYTCLGCNRLEEDYFKGSFYCENYKKG